MFKKVIYSIIIFIIIISNINIVLCDDTNEEVIQNDLIEVMNQSTDEPVLNCRIAVAYDRKSGNIIWGKEENKKTAMASTTKIMTAILVIENYDLNETITVSRKSCINWWIKIRFEKK